MVIVMVMVMATATDDGKLTTASTTTEIRTKDTIIHSRFETLLLVHTSSMGGHSDNYYSRPITKLF